MVQKKNKQLVLHFLVVCIGLVLGMYFSIRSNSSQHAAGLNGEPTEAMHHGVIEVGSDCTVPFIRGIELQKDNNWGWNIYLDIEGFTFSPQKVDAEHVAGEGHVHLTVNGKKTARVYSNWYHLGIDAPELTSVEVSINANNHAVMSRNGVPIVKRVFLNRNKGLRPTEQCQ